MKSAFVCLLATLAVVCSACNHSPTSVDQAASAGHEALVVVDDGNFQQVVLESDQPVLVDFWATWCGPCQQIAPTVAEIANEFQGRAVVAKLDVDQAGEVATRYKIEAIPTLIVFNQGQEVSRVVGMTDKAELAQQLQAVLRQ